MNRFSVEAVFKAIDKVTGPVRRMTSTVNRFAKESERSVHRLDRSISRTNNTMMRGGRTAAVGIAATTAALSKLVMVGAEFDHNLAASSARFFYKDILDGMDLVTARSLPQFKAFKEAAMEVGRTTEHTASQAAESLKFLAMAGFSVGDAIVMLPKVANFATANITDMAWATDMATDSLGAFGLSVDHIQDPVKRSEALMHNINRVMDAMTLTANAANLNITQLFESIKQGGPVGKIGKQQLETTMAMAGIIANAGIKGQRAGVALKNILLAINAPTPAAGELFDRLGLKNFDREQNKIKDAVAFMEELSAAMNNLPLEEQNPAYNILFGKIPLPSAATLTESIAKVRKFRDEIYAAENITDAAAAYVRDDTLNKIKTFWSAVSSVVISTFYKIRIPLEGATLDMTQWVRKTEEAFSGSVAKKITHFIENFDEIKNNTIFIMKLAGLWLAATIAIKSYLLILSAIAALSTPVGLGVAVIGALVAGMAWFATHVDEISESFNSWPGMFKWIGKILDFVLIKPIQGLQQVARWFGEKLWDYNNRDRDWEREGQYQYYGSAGPSRLIYADQSRFALDMMLRTDKGMTVEQTSGGKLPSYLRIDTSGDF